MYRKTLTFLKSAGWVIVLVAVAWASGSLHTSVSAEGITNQYCPVLPSEPVDENIYTEYDGKRVYFCCNKCRRDFLADPEKYAAILDSLSGPPASVEAEVAGHHRDDDHGHQHSHGGHSHDEPTVQNGPESDTIDHIAESSHDVGEHQHDHASDHGQSSSIVTFAGKFHPLIIHFPIATVLVALLFSALALFLKRESFDTVSVQLVYVGALSGVAAVLLGFAAGSGASFPSNIASYYQWHRAFGIGSSILTVVTAYIGHWSLRHNPPRSMWLYRLSLLINAIAIGITGHFGATLVYGPDHFTF